MATTNFAGSNQRSLESYLNECGTSTIDFVPNKSGRIFAVLGNGKQVTCSQQVSDAILDGSITNLADMQVCDMPSKDATTGLPDGKVFALITRRSTSNVKLALHI